MISFWTIFVFPHSSYHSNQKYQKCPTLPEWYMTLFEGPTSQYPSAYLFSSLSSLLLLSNEEKNRKEKKLQLVHDPQIGSFK